MELLLIIVITVILLYVFTRKKSSLDAIPGPKPYPLVGNVLQLDMKHVFIDVSKLGQKYGGIFKLKLFSSPVVVVSDPESIYEVLVKQSGNFAGRPYSYRAGFVIENLGAIALVDEGVEHKSRRKDVHSFLKQFGSGIEKIEQVTQTATDDLIRSLADCKGEPVDISMELVNCVTDIAVILLRGQTLSKEEIQVIKHSLDEGFAATGMSGSGVFLDMFPIVRFLGNKAYKQLQYAKQIKEEMVSGWFKEEPTEGYISFLQCMSEKAKQQSYLESELIQRCSVWEFLAAGVYTTSTTLTSLMNVLAHYPRVQEKLREEVMRVIGSARHPTLKDQDKLPYLRATLIEIGRYASIVPFSLPHKTTKNSSLCGYDIPAETDVWVNLWALHHDEKLWDEPFAFKPERYLDAEGDLVAADHPNRKNVMPFSAGQRVCVGEVFAISRMFLITARILQHFTILPESSVEKQPSCDPRNMRMGLVLIPPPFKVRLEAIDHN